MARECITLFTVGSLRDLLIEERECLRALSGPVEELREKLTQLEDMFHDIDVRRDERTSDIADNCNQMIGDIDTYVFRESTKMFGFRERKLRPKLLLKIRQLIVKITNLINSHRGKTAKVGQGSSLGLSTKVPPLDEEDFVGRENDIECLVSYLEDSSSRIIAICGMGGLGKTTLSKKISKNNRVTSNFERYAFVRLGQDCDDLKTISQKILLEIVPRKGEDIKFMGDAELVEQLKKVLSEKRCLVVVDDVWSVDAWTSFCRALPTNDQSSHSKLLVTTRNRVLAQVGDIVHDLKGLSEEESWELLQRKALAGIRGRDSNIDTRMEKLGKEMVGWCVGNPLAVRVLRGVLVTKPSFVEWERVYYGFRRKNHELVENLHKEVDEVLSLSYNELPYQLKPCFLYLCRHRFKMNTKVDFLYMLWNAEGMILSRDRKCGETMIEVAERYVDELVQRNMVEVDVDSWSGPKELRRLKLCNLHDLMHDLCISIIKKEGFFKITYRNDGVDDDNGSHWLSSLGDSTKRMGVFSEVEQDSMKIQRHSIYFNPNTNWYIDATPEIRATVRSLRIDQGLACKLSDLKKLKLLRVLELDAVGTDDSHLSEGIGNLIHMRFLSLRYVTLSRLPSSLCNLRNVQTLDLRVSLTADDITLLPNVLCRLTKLRHLFLPKYFRVSWYSSFCRLHELQELETLVNFLSPTCCANDLTFLTKLMKFKAVISLKSYNPNGIKDLEAVMNYIKLNVNRLRLSSLSIVFGEVEAAAGWQLLLLGCQWILHSLSIFALKGKLPDIWRDVSNQQHPFPLLTKLSFTGCTFEKWPFPTLEKLSNLRSLSFERFKVEESNGIIFSASGFPQLRELSFTDVNLDNQWTIEQGAMPNLSSLVILRCSIQMLPEGLKFITTLKKLFLLGFPDTFEKRIEPPAGEDFYKVRHVPNITFVNADDLLTSVTAYSHGQTFP